LYRLIASDREAAGGRVVEEPMTRRFRITASLAAFALVLAACQSESSPGGGGDGDISGETVSDGRSVGGGDRRLD
jgi:hypothetical protein